MPPQWNPFVNVYTITKNESVVEKVTSNKTYILYHAKKGSLHVASYKKANIYCIFVFYDINSSVQ